MPALLGHRFPPERVDRPNPVVGLGRQHRPVFVVAVSMNVDALRRWYWRRRLLPEEVAVARVEEVKRVREW